MGATSGALARASMAYFNKEVSRDYSRWLIVSDKPETPPAIPNGASAAWLYYVDIDLEAHPNPSFRVLVWHENTSGSTKFVHLVAKGEGQK